MPAATERGGTVGDYDYALPEGRIAAYPAARRDGSRLLVLDRGTGSVAHRGFTDLVDLVDPGDLLVVNESKVLPARLKGTKPTGASVEVLLLRPSETHDWRRARRWEAMVRPGGKLKPGRTVDLGPKVRLRIIDSVPPGLRIVEFESEASTEEILAEHGSIPLPPYMGREAEAMDEDRYQTVYARRPGSVAAPTAGLHFTAELLAELDRLGVARAAISLHIGPGTFRPVEVEDPGQHEMHRESFEVPDDTALRIAETRERGGRIWAVGTTVVRALESAVGPDGRVAPGPGETELFIRPPYPFRVVDALVTNFHLPRSTLLMLVAAFGGYDQVMRAYEEAVSGGYRFYSYGDAMAVVGSRRGPGLGASSVGPS